MYMYRSSTSKDLQCTSKNSKNNKLKEIDSLNNKQVKTAIALHHVHVSTIACPPTQHKDYNQIWTTCVLL